MKKIPSYSIPLVPASTGGLTEWEKLAMGLAHANAASLRENSRDLSSKASDLASKEAAANEALKKTKLPELKKSAALIVMAILLPLLGGASWFFLEQSIALISIGSTIVVSGVLAFAVFSIRTKNEAAQLAYQKAVQEQKNSILEIAREKENILKTIPRLMYDGIAKILPRFASLSVDEDRFLVSLDSISAGKSKKKKSIINISSETSRQLEEAHYHYDQLKHGRLPCMLTLEDGIDDPNNLNASWGEERRLGEAAARFAKILMNVGLRTIEFPEAERVFFNAVCRGQQMAAELPTEIPIKEDQQRALIPVFESSQLARNIREHHQKSLKQHLTDVAEEIDRYYALLKTYRETSISDVLCGSVEKIMEVFRRKNIVFLNPELNPEPVVMPPVRISDSEEWVQQDGQKAALEKEKINAIFGQTMKLTNMVNQTMQFLREDPGDSHDAILDDVKKALDTELNSRDRRIKALFENPEVQSFDERSQNLSAQLKLNNPSAALTESTYEEEGGSGFAKIAGKILDEARWECSLTQAVFDQDEASRMRWEKFYLLREMLQVFWARRREEKNRIMSAKEAELRQNVNLESQDIREEAKIFTEEIRSLREMINEEIRNTEKSKAGCNRLLGELSSLKVLNPSETERIKSALLGDDSKKFKDISDELEKTLEGEVGFIAARRQQVLFGVGTDQEVLRLEKPEVPALQH